MLLIAEHHAGQRQLALAFDIGLVGAIDHDVRNIGIVEQFLQRTKAEQFIDQHLFQRELLAAVEGDLQLCQHLEDDGTEFLGQLVLRQGRCRFGIDAFEETRQHLFLDLVDRLLEALRAIVDVLVRHARVEAVHRIVAAVAAGCVTGRNLRQCRRIDGRELAAALLARSRAGRKALHGLGDTECGARCLRSGLPSECAHGWLISCLRTNGCKNGMVPFLHRLSVDK